MNENHIKKLEIKNFKSIKEMELDCSRINVFVGKPNVGKSNTLEAIGLLADNSYNENKYFSEQVRYNSMSNLFYDNDTTKDIVINANHKNDDIFSSIKPKSVVLTEDGAYLAVWGKDYSTMQEAIDKYGKLGGIINSSNPNPKLAESVDAYRYVSHNGKLRHDLKNDNLVEINSEKPSIKKYTFLNKELDKHPFTGYLIPPHGDNLVSIVQNNKEFRDEVAQLFTSYGHEIVLDFQEKTFEIQKRIDNISYKTDYNLIADTLQREIFHYAAIYSNENSVILFEEPESHSYPPYISDLAYKIIESKTNQFFITTHSPYLLNTLMENTPREELSVFVATYKNYETHMQKLNDQDFSDIFNNGVDLFFNLRWFDNE